MSKPKILQVIDRLETGGAERVFLNLTYLLLNENLPVDMLLISGQGALSASADPRAGKYFLCRKWKFNPFKMLECAAICSRYQIVHVHMRHTYSYVRLSQIISFKNFKIIFHDHFGDTEMTPGNLFILKGLLKPGYYIGVSRHLVNWAISKLRIDKSRAFLLRNTVIPSTEIIQMDTNKDLLMVSNISAIKNIELGIELANKLRRHLTIYGNARATTYGENILKMMEESAYVTLIQGETSVQRFFKNYATALHCAFSETGPLVLIEYLAQGLPFLAHYAGEVAYILKDEIPECFIETLDVNAWIEKLQYLENSPPSSEKLKLLFNKYFGTKQYVEECLNIYKKVSAGFELPLG